MDGLLEQGMGEDYIVQYYTRGCLTLSYCLFHFKKFKEARIFLEKAELFILTSGVRGKVEAEWLRKNLD